MTNTVKPAVLKKAAELTSEIERFAASASSDAKAAKAQATKIIKAAAWLRSNEAVFADADSALGILNVIEELADLQVEAATLTIDTKLGKTASKAVKLA